MAVLGVRSFVRSAFTRMEAYPIAPRLVWMRLALVAILGGLLAASLFGQVNDSVGPFGLSVSWKAAWPGTTQLSFPPLGDVEANTHSSPGRLVVNLESIHFGQLRRLVDATTEDQGAAISQLTSEAYRLSARLAWQLLLLAALGGAGAAALVSVGSRVGRTPGVVSALTGGLISLVVIGTLLGATRATYTIDAFRSPTYRGALEEVPWLIRTVQDGLTQFEELDARLRRLSRNVYDMYRRVETLQPPVSLTDADRVILHVSDFHNHPTAAGIVVEIAEAFDVDLVLNTGDLTDFGTRVEAALLGDLSQLRVPHYIVSGNHESPEVIQHINLLPYIQLLDGNLVEDADLRIAGMGDPGAQSDSAAVLSPAEALEFAQAINERLINMDQLPDVVAVHNHRVAQGIQPGLVPLVAFGHTHTPSVQFRAGTAYVNAGTTGGAGIRGVEAGRVVPITLSVIYFRLTPEERRVIAVDVLELSPVAGGFSLERHIAPVPDDPP